MAQLAKNGEVLDAAVTQASRRCLGVDVGLRGFVPLSELGSVGNLASPERGAIPSALSRVRRQADSDQTSSRQISAAIA